MNPSDFPTAALTDLINFLEAGTLAQNYRAALQDAAVIIGFGIGMFAGPDTTPNQNPQATATAAPADCPPCDPHAKCPELASRLKPALEHCRAMAAAPQAGAPTQAGAVNWVSIVQTALTIALSILAGIPK